MVSISHLTSRLRGFAIGLSAVSTLLVAIPGAAAAGEAPSGPGAGSPAARSHVAQTQARSSVATHGVVITWNESANRFEAPDAVHAAELARELRSLLAGQTGRRAGLSEKVEVEVLPSGIARARLPVSLLDLSVIRPTGHGTFAPVCSQGPEGARRVLATPYTGSGPVER